MPKRAVVGFGVICLGALDENGDDQRPRVSEVFASGGGRGRSDIS
jgi:hypothetical protein